MKKNTKYVLLAIFLGIAYFIYQVVSGFMNPGGNRKYDIDVSSILTEEIDKVDSIHFTSIVQPNIYSDLLALTKTHEFIYNPKTKQKISTCNDTILDFHLSSIISNKSNSLYFATFLVAVYVHGNDSVIPYFSNQTILSAAILEDKISGKTKYISSFDGGYGYDSNKLSLNDERVLVSTKKNIQYVLIDYNYYIDIIPFIKVPNPFFWKGINN